MSLSELPYDLWVEILCIGGQLALLHEICADKTLVKSSIAYVAARRIQTAFRRYTQIPWRPRTASALDSLPGATILVYGRNKQPCRAIVLQVKHEGDDHEGPCVVATYDGTQLVFLYDNAEVPCSLKYRVLQSKHILPPSSFSTFQILKAILD
eukprot:6212327-Pleurochrysis_carterae.AAC.1